MSKKSKKRKHKKSSSSSGEDDEKASKEHSITKHCKTAKRTQDVQSQESCAAKQENCAFPTIKDVSQSSRHIKKPIFRLAKTEAADQTSVNKEEECTKRKPFSMTFHGGKCCNKAKNYISGKYNAAGGSKIVERGPSKHINNAGTVPQRTQEASKCSLDGKTSWKSPPKLKKQLMSPSLVSAEQKEQAQNVLKRGYGAEEPSRTGNDSNTIKTREPNKPSVDSMRQKRRELVKEMCQRHQEHKFEAKRSPHKYAKTPSTSTAKQSSIAAKHTAFVSSSNVANNVTSVPGIVTSVSHEIATSSSAQQQISSIASPLPPNFKIPKKVQPSPVDSAGENNDAISTNRNQKCGTELSDSGASADNPKQETIQHAHSCLDVTPSLLFQGPDKRSSLSGQLPATFDTVTQSWYDQMQVVEELHIARSEKRLEVDVMQSYGELTCMDIDPSEEGAADTYCKQLPQQDLILVLDTNILLSHMDYVKKIISHGLGALGFPVVLIPWVVLQELDYLKRGRSLPHSVAHLATPAISYIYNSLKRREPRLWGQSMQQAAESRNGLNAENNDDRVLQCCLQYQSLYPGCTLILCTNDKNLSSKALVSGLKALCKNDLEAEVGKSRHGFHSLQNIKTSTLPNISPQVSSPTLTRSYSSVQAHIQQRTGTELSAELIEEDKQLIKREGEEKTKLDLSRCVSDLEDCLRVVLSDVLEMEMKAVYEELWLEIVYRKPPWTLQDVLQCLKKHWTAVFGHIVPRRKLQTVLSLTCYFNSGETVDCSTTLAALQEAKELVKAFGRSSSRVPSAISIMDNIFNKLHQPQGESPSPACDVVMNDDNEDKQPTSAQVSHQGVWALFEDIWSNVYQISLEVFKALGFDPHTMQSAQPAGGPPPPQDALVCLHKLSSILSQLLQAFSSVLSSAPGLVEVQTLLGIIHSNKIANVDSRLTAKDLLDCFSQQDYREKLRVGGTQLMELKEALDCCVGTPFTT